MNRSQTAFTRRAFLQSALALGGATLLDAGLFAEASSAGPPLSAGDRLLVVVELNGGLDGLNTLVPFGNGIYYDKRRALAVPADRVAPLDGMVGLHANLPYLRQRYDSGDVAIVRGVGQFTGDRSHFSSAARVMSGLPDGQVATTGWLGRFADGVGYDGFGSLSIGSAATPLLLRGMSSEPTLLPLESSGLPGADQSTPHDRLSYAAVSSFASAPSGFGVLGDRLARRYADAVAAAAIVNPIYQPQIVGGPQLASLLTLAARALNLDVGVRLVHLRRYGFDTHSGQLGVDASLLRELDEGLSAFFGELLPQFHSRTVVMTVTEFGRRVEANGALGTDHGASSVCFLVGSRVKGGLHGAQPSLTDLDERGDLRVHVDHRSIAASVLADWLGADDREVLGATYAALDLFETEGACAPATASVASDARYRPIVPARLLDTRLGIGAPARRLGPRQQVDVGVLGRGTMPNSGVSAVVLNVTATAPDAASYLTVWPAGTARPVASNLNVVPGATVPNLVISKVGPDGSVAIFNERGSVDVIADIVGWFPATSSYRPLQPARLLDTRLGLGAAPGKVGPRRTLRLSVAGRGGVPDSGAAAAVLNVTAAEPDAVSWVTLWPARQPRPYASNLNLRPGRAVPNLVIAKLSADGMVDIYNDAGSTHLIVDVFGWFPPDGGFHAVDPQRILDTRVGTGARGRLRANQVLDVDAACVGGVPANASAVVVNVTAAEPSREGYLTVWPSGSALPPTSSLNFVAGDVVPNLVITKIGIGGMISMLSPTGGVHVIADVLGWFE